MSFYGWFILKNQINRSLGERDSEKKWAKDVKKKAEMPKINFISFTILMAGLRHHYNQSSCFKAIARERG